MIGKKKDLVIRVGELEAKLAAVSDERETLRSRLWESNAEIDYLWGLQETLLRALEYIAYVPVREGEGAFQYQEVARGAVEKYEKDSHEREDFLALRNMVSLYLDPEDPC